jgi:hypothetical protein
VVDRRFWVTDGRRADFEIAFGANGLWAGLLTRADGYLFTEVECETPEERRYRVRDFWNWHRDFEGFRARFQSEYERFESWLSSDKVIQKEQFLGAYYEKAPGDEDELVSG